MISICVANILFSLITLILVGNEYRKQHFSKKAFTGVFIAQILSTLLSLFHIYGLA